MCSVRDSFDLLVLGASFAGLEVVRGVRRRVRGRNMTIAVVDRQATHGYIPLVHERLCGRIDFGATELDTRAYLERHARAHFVHEEVVGFDPAHHIVQLAGGGRLHARFVVVALGSVLAPPSTLRGREHLLVHKFAPELMRAREALVGALASSQASTLVVIGGGITGVELAAELARLLRSSRVDASVPAHRHRVVLVHAGQRLLPKLSPRASEHARASLAAAGVELMLATRVVEVDVERVRLEHGGVREDVAVSLAFWAGGVSPAPVFGGLGLPLVDDGAGRGWLRVGPTLQCFPGGTASERELFACGDAVRIVGGMGTWPTMQRAIECLWQADVVARNVLRLATQPPDYTSGMPGLLAHELREDFPFGISLGDRSMVAYGRMWFDLGPVTAWFRRWLLEKYFDRYSA